jgi:hypothetical protein
MSSNENTPQEPEPEPEPEPEEESSATGDGAADSPDTESPEGDRPIIIQGGTANPD